MKNVINTLHFIVENGLASWFIWRVPFGRGVLILIAGMLAMYFIEAAAYLETPLSFLMLILMIYFFEKLTERKK